MSNEKIEKGLVFIVMPCYNGAKYIKETINSVKAQSYQKWELLIVDDGSTDDSITIIKKYFLGDSRIHLIRQKNSGSAAARNNGIKHSKGQYLALLDSDDVWLPGFLDSQIRFISQKGAVCVCSSYMQIDEHSNEILKPITCKSVITSKDMKVRNYIGCLTGLFDQSVYGKIYLREGLVNFLDDYAFWNDVINLEGVAYGNPKILAKYRVHSDSLTGSKMKLVKKHFSFYRDVFSESVFRSIFNTLRWAGAGIKNKYI